MADGYNWWFVIDLNISMNDLEQIDNIWYVEWKNNIEEFKSMNLGDVYKIKYNSWEKVYSFSCSSSMYGRICSSRHKYLIDIQTYICTKQDMKSKDINSAIANDNANWELIKTVSMGNKATFCVDIQNIKSPFLKFRISKTYGNAIACIENVSIKPKTNKITYKLHSLQ